MCDITLSNGPWCCGSDPVIPPQAETEKPEEEKLPTDWKNLTSFQRLLVLRCLRPDRITAALEGFVAEQIGKNFVSDQAVPLDISFEDSTPTTPIFFILSPGIDPVQPVETLGIKMGFREDDNKFFNVSLGQVCCTGLGPSLRRHLRTGRPGRPGPRIGRTGPLSAQRCALPPPPRLSDGGSGSWSPS